MVNFFSTLPRLHLLVVGDLMLDRFLQGVVTRISPEAPVPVVRLDRSWATAGGAGHVAASLSGLGCRVTVAGFIGTDTAGEELRESLTTAGVRLTDLVVSTKRQTVTKTRILAQNAQQILRLDEEPDQNCLIDHAISLATRVAARVHEFDGVILSDYEKGTLVPRGIRAILDATSACVRPTVVDPKKSDMAIYAGCTILTPNMNEAERAVGRSFRSDADVEVAACELRLNARSGTLLITRGPQGMTGADELGVFHIPTRVRDVADVTGAGDTVAAVVGAALAAGVGVREGCELASLAAGIAVSRHGTYVVRAEELRAATGSAGSAKVLTPDEAALVVLGERSRGRTVVFTNGCFDLLHPGHVYSLQRARAEGDFLVVGLNSDISVRSLKGAGRPVLPEHQRAALLAGLECVGAVVVFDTLTPEPLIERVKPDVLVKGGDYTQDEVVGAELVRSWGGRVVIVPRLEGLSTTNLIQRLG